MYFDKASSLLPFVSNPFSSVCYLYSRRINCYCYNVLYLLLWIYLCIQLLYLLLLLPSTTLLCNPVLLSAPVCALTSPSEILTDCLWVTVTYRWQAAGISRNSDNDILPLPFPCSFCFNSARQFAKKQVSNNSSPLLTKDSLYSLQFTFLFFFLLFLSLLLSLPDNS